VGADSCGAGGGAAVKQSRGIAAWAKTLLRRRPRRGCGHTDSIVKQREGVHPHSRGAMRPSSASIATLKEKEGAGKAGCTLHPRSRVQTCTKKRTRAYRFSGGNPAFPARWFTAYFALSPVTGLSCHRHPREVLLPANLTPASGRQDHTTSPSATATFVIRCHRVHRIPPRVRDDRDPPLSSGETREAKSLICPTG
jgi:hypothetical protein